MSTTINGMYEEEYIYCGELFFSPSSVEAHIEKYHREEADEDPTPDSWYGP